MHLEGLRCRGGDAGAVVADVGAHSTSTVGTTAVAADCCSAICCSAAAAASAPDCSDAKAGRLALPARTCVLVEAADAEGSALAAAAAAACLSRFRGGTDAAAALAAAAAAVWHATM